LGGAAPGAILIHQAIQAKVEPVIPLRVRPDGGVKILTIPLLAIWGKLRCRLRGAGECKTKSKSYVGDGEKGGSHSNPREGFLP